MHTRIFNVTYIRVLLLTDISKADQNKILVGYSTYEIIVWGRVFDIRSVGQKCPPPTLHNLKIRYDVYKF